MLYLQQYLIHPKKTATIKYMVGEQQGESGIPSSVTPPEKQFPRPEAQTAQETAPATDITTKVVDASGQPLTVYHGTIMEFEEFKQGARNPYSTDNLYGPGTYFTEKRSIAEGYARMAGGGVTGNILEAKLDIRNPFMVDDTVSPSLRQKLKELEDDPRVADVLYRNGYKDYRQQLAHYIEDDPVNPHTWYAENDKLWRYENEHYDGTGDPLSQPRVWREEKDLITNETVYRYLDSVLVGRQAANDWLKAVGFDGITYTGGKIMGFPPHRVWLAFDVSQIKMVTNPPATPVAQHTRPPAEPRPVSSPLTEKPLPLAHPSLKPPIPVKTSLFARIKSLF